MANAHNNVMADHYRIRASHTEWNSRRTPMPNPAISGVYAIINRTNGKVYIGSSADVFARLQWHQGFLRRGKHTNPHLQRAWNVYGEDAFIPTFVEQQPEGETLAAQEQRWMNTMQPEYNILRAARSALGFRHTPETLARMSIVQKGRTWTPEQRAQISDSLKGRSLSAETRAKMGAARRGVPRSAEVRAKVSAGLMGHVVTEETRAKCRAAKTGRKQDPEVVARRAATNRARHAERRQRSQPSGECS